MENKLILGEGRAARKPSGVVGLNDDGTVTLPSLVGTTTGRLDSSKPNLSGPVSPIVVDLPAGPPPAPIKKVDASGPESAFVRFNKAPGYTLKVTKPFTLNGTSFSGYDFESLEFDQAVYLVPDPFGDTTGNKHKDPDAVSVQDDAGQHIAYIPGKDCPGVSKALRGGRHEYLAKIKEIKGGGEKKSGEKLNFGVDITVMFFKKNPPEAADAG